MHGHIEIKAPPGEAAGRVANFLRRHARAGDFILAPPGMFQPSFDYAEVFIEPSHSFHWVIVHLDRIEEIEPSFLARLLTKSLSVFHDSPFLVFAREEVAAERMLPRIQLPANFDVSKHRPPPPKPGEWVARCDPKMFSAKVEIVVGHFQEDIGWTGALPYPAVIISKTRRDLQGFVSPNRGLEVPLYLAYIAARYDNLPEMIGFFHGHGHSPHQQFASADIIRSVRLDDIHYLNVNGDNRINIVRAAETWPDNRYGYRLISSLWPTLFAPYLGAAPEEFRSYGHAQFFVRRELVRSVPLAAYRHWLEWIMTVDLPIYWSSRVFEYLWHYILRRRAIEPPRKLTEHLNLEMS